MVKTKSDGRKLIKPGRFQNLNQLQISKEDMIYLHKIELIFSVNHTSAPWDLKVECTSYIPYKKLHDIQATYKLYTKAYALAINNHSKKLQQQQIKLKFMEFILAGSLLELFVTDQSHTGFVRSHALQYQKYPLYGYSSHRVHLPGDHKMGLLFLLNVNCRNYR